MRTLFILVFALMACDGFSQKTAMTLQQCEDALQKNNLELLSQHFELTSAQAAIVQAKIWEHPYITADFNAYNPDAGKFFDVRNQKTVAIDQLIYLGGKKRNEVKLAKKNAEIAALRFEELLYNLKFELRKSFYAIYFDDRKMELLENQIGQIENLLSAYEVQADKGNIALKEVVRLQSLLLDLKNERLGIFRSTADERRNLALITAIDTPISPIADEKVLVSQFRSLLHNTNDLLVIGKEKNPEYRLSLSEIEARQIEIKWQQALSIPDVTIGAGYDQQSGAFRNEVNARIGIPLPLWNKNKGNIKIAKSELEQSKLDSQFKASELKADIDAAYAIWEENRKQTSGIRESVYDNLETVNRGIFSNFQKRNISLLEFTDFMESYNQSILQINESYKQLILSGETLNHLVNTTIF